MREYGFTWAEIQEACGDMTRAIDRVSTAGPVTVRPGRPVKIGVQAPCQQSTDRKDVYLGATCRGRPCVIVMTQAAGTDRPRQVVTLWDPASPENRQYWQQDFAAPTRAGIQILPPTTWFRPIGAH